jgi:EF hand domain-containing protein
MTDRLTVGRDRATPKLGRTSRRQLLVALLFAGIGTSSPAVARRASFAAIDRDQDGTIDLEEAKHAAELLFDQLDRDHTGKLSRQQLGHLRVSLAEFSWADRDHDGTLTKHEYLELVERQFKAAAHHHGGVVTRAAFESRSGLPLRRLLY